MMPVSELVVPNLKQLDSDYFPKTSKYLNNLVNEAGAVTHAQCSQFNKEMK